MTGINPLVLVTFVFWIMVIGIVYSQGTGNELAFNKGIQYLQTSPGHIWNATDYAAYAVVSKNFPQTFALTNSILDQKKTFNPEQYPFTNSLLGPSTVLPSDFENGLITPIFLKKIYSCEDFSPTEFLNLSNKKNTKQNPFDGSHAVLFLSHIKKNYTNNCLKADQSNQASQSLQLALNGLSITELDGFDPFLEQECARGIATGSVSPAVSQLVLSTQDQLFGGWYHSKKKMNEDWYDEIEKKTQIGEYPNGHTTMFALCVLSVELGKL